MARAPFDYELSIAGQETAADRAAYEAELTPAPRRPSKTTAEQRRKESEARASRGDRIDYRRHLLINLPPDYRIVPNEEMTQAAKRRRTASLQTAAERRTRVRQEGGTKVRGRDFFRSGKAEGHPEMTPWEDRWFRGWRPEGWFLP